MHLNSAGESTDSTIVQQPRFGFARPPDWALVYVVRFPFGFFDLFHGLTKELDVLSIRLSMGDRFAVFAEDFA